MTTESDHDVWSASPIALFCSYLEHRLLTENIELLRRIIDEFLATPREQETIESMVRFAFPMVTLFPIDHSDPSARACARLLLKDMRADGRKHHTTTSRFTELHAILSTKIILREWRWLERIYDEFCVGGESTLVEFVRLQRRAIAIIPARPIRLHPTRLLATASAATVGVDAVKTNPLEALDSNSEATTVHPSSRPQYVRLSQNGQTLLAAISEIESQTPWATLYDISQLQHPFAPRDDTEIVTNLRSFWRTHARAVWERNFWYRFPQNDPANAARQHQRVRRQENAHQSFQNTVMIPCYQRFGAQFFVDLDVRRERASWWWYRRPIVDIVRFADRDGLATSIAYLRSQAWERFPDSPDGCEVHHEKHHGDGRSMWSVREKLQWITDEIDQLKRAT